MTGDSDEVPRQGDPAGDGTARLIESVTILTVSAIVRARELLEAGESPYLIRSGILDTFEPAIQGMPELQRQAATRHVGRVLDEFFADRRPGGGV